MGNRDSHVDGETIIKVLEENGSLSGDQSLKLYSPYYSMLDIALPDVNTRGCQYLTYTRQQYPTRLKSIGYFRGKIVAFMFNINSTKPCLLFEYQNLNFKTSYALLKEAYTNHLKETLLPGRLIITTLNIDVKESSGYQWVVNVSPDIL